MKNTQVNYTKILVLTGLLIAISLVIKYFSTYVYILGIPALRVGFSGPFSNLPGILFGPVIGGITKALVDVLGYLMKPTGGYIPLLTVTAILGGILVPILWKSLKNIDSNKLQKIFLVIFLGIGFLGFTNHIFILFFPETSIAQSILLLGGKNEGIATIGLEATSLIGLILYTVNYYVKKKYKNSFIQDNFLKLIIALGISGIIVTTLNTQILRLFIPALSKKAFMLLWIPRLIEEILMTIFNAYVVSLLLQVTHKISKD